VVHDIAEQYLDDFIIRYPYSREFFSSLFEARPPKNLTIEQWIKSLNVDTLRERGMERHQILEYLDALIYRMNESKINQNRKIIALSIIGGRNKRGWKERVTLTIRPGEVVSLVGPTGAGKSCLLADIECLAQKDTPSKRQILLNHTVPNSAERFDLENKLVAQISQNMNFVVDLSVVEFITMHARSRMVHNEDEVAKNIIECANTLTGEKFSPQTSITQLSGGQSRALMIADTALLSHSPIILIDEIENAGVDRKRALDLLVSQDKIVFIATHDPLLALSAKTRIVIKNGGIANVITTDNREQHNIDALEKLDDFMLRLRYRIRTGDKITESLDFSTLI